MYTVDKDGLTLVSFGWTGDRVPAGAGNFSLDHRVQTGSGAHQPPIQELFPWG